MPAAHCPAIQVPCGAGSAFIGSPRRRLQPAILKAAGKLASEPEFDDGERACLEVAELFVQDPHAISDELASAAIARLGEAGFVALAEALAMIDSRVRIQCMLQVSPAEGKPAK